MEAEGSVRVITGATAGIGRALAKQLAAAGGTIVLVGRDEARVVDARNEIAVAAPNANVGVHVADLSRQADIRALGREPSTAHPRIQTVVHSAAFFLSQRVETEDGLELMFASAGLTWRSTIPMSPTRRVGGHIQGDRHAR